MTTNLVLVVDDDDETFHAVASVLRAHYQVLNVAHGESALAFCESENVAIALIAQNLPDLDGLEVLMRMRVVARGTALIFMAEQAGKELVLSVFRAGADDFIEKPIVAAALLESLARLDASRPRARPEEVQCSEHVALEIRRGRHHAQRLALKYWFAKLRVFLQNVWTRFIADPRPTLNFTSSPSVLPVEALPNPQDATANLGATTMIAKNFDEESDAIVRLRVHCLGRFQVFILDNAIEHWPSRKGRNLFAYLAIEHKHRIYRDALMEIFWPTSTPEAARNSLHVTIHSIRSHLRRLDVGREYILYQEECYFLNPEIEIWLDIEDFLHYWRIAQRAARDKHNREAIENYELAAALYQGEFMEDEPYENWPAQQRENLKETYLTILDHLSESYKQDGHQATAIKLCDRILTRDNCRENVYRRLMQCYCEIGQRDKALRVFQQCTEALLKELEAKPTHTTMQLYERIKRDS